MLTKLFAAGSVAFPGLGISPFKLDPVAFTLFGREVRWYGILICIGMILAVAYIMSRAKYEKIKTDDVVDLAIFTIIISIIGARIYYILFQLDEYIVKGDFWATVKRMVAIWEGGIAIYGALIAGFITVYFVCRHKKLRFATVLDVVAPGVLIGQIVGRWGNFFNMEAFGVETDLPWRMFLSSDGLCHHPTFFYESFWNLIG
ncbi:MAG: prolipoprotein diacylglyceryl transferase, partial [Clostridia bacterium]|nr:prolipoprotein diacylglyceryl transferase [Clostridia bacterium]